MSTVDKFILSGYWKLVTNKGEISSFTSELISKGRTISINLADNDTQRHFMGQPIYGIVKDLKT